MHVILLSRPKSKQHREELSLFICEKDTPPTKMDRQDSAVVLLDCHRHTALSLPLIESSMKKTHRSDELLHDADQEQQSRPTDKKNNNTQSSSSRTRRSEEDNGAVASEFMPEDSGRERLKRHRVEVAGRVWIPDIWGQEELLKDWIDCSAFDASLVPAGIMSARAALADEGGRANSSGLRIEDRC